MTEPTQRPWHSCKPVHTTYQGWSVLIHTHPIPACRAIGVTRGHALANANLITRAVIINDRVARILAKPPADHEEARKLSWLKEKLAE